MTNKHLINDLIKLGLCPLEMKDEILRHKGSIQAISTIPDHIKEIQNHLGNKAEECYRHGCRQRCLHRPEPINEYPHD